MFFFFNFLVKLDGDGVKPARQSRLKRDGGQECNSQQTRLASDFSVLAFKLWLKCPSRAGCGYDEVSGSRRHLLCFNKQSSSFAHDQKTRSIMPISSQCPELRSPNLNPLECSERGPPSSYSPITRQLGPSDQAWKTSMMQKGPTTSYYGLQPLPRRKTLRSDCLPKGGGSSTNSLAISVWNGGIVNIIRTKFRSMIILTT